MPKVVVVDYDPGWVETFSRIRDRVSNAMGDTAVAIEHVGSTSVPGLAAKPIIDITVIIPTPEALPAAIEKLGTIGYEHRGNLGVEGREAFSSPRDLPKHHLYVCPKGSLGLRNHLAVRDYLRTNEDAAIAYGKLKLELATRFPDDIDSYIDGKTEFLLEILRRSGLTPSEMNSISGSNRKD